MAKAIGYKPNSTNINKGYRTHGSFKNEGQKSGKKSVVGKEKVKNTSNLDFMKQTIATLRSQGKRRINMLPNTGAYH